MATSQSAQERAHELTTQKNDNINIIGSRLDQLRGIVALIQNCWDDDQNQFVVGDQYLYSAMYAVSELLDQADNAFWAYIDASGALKKVEEASQ